MNSLGAQQTLLDDTTALDSSLAASIDEDVDGEYGAVFTKPWVVEMILDLVGYTSDRDLGAMIAIEPACGHGSFLGPMVRRLVESCRAHNRELSAVKSAIEAFDLQPTNVIECRGRIASELVGLGVPENVSRSLADAWVHHSDFLLARHQLNHADFVVGNPPYIRLEAVSEERSVAYRRVCETMAGRSDVYVGFFEVGLKALKEGGGLGFICADRWMRNQYGQRLRAWIAEHFSVETAIEMHDVDAFDREVSAYPSVIVIRRREQSRAVVANTNRSFDGSASKRLLAWSPGIENTDFEDTAFEVAELGAWFKGTAPWPSGSARRIATVRELERRFPTLEDPQTGTRVGIGVATGADKVFISVDPPDVEPECLLPLAMARDTMSGEMNWSGHHLVNPWCDSGEGLVDLQRFPKLKAYFDEHADALRARNVAGRRPIQWFRTIDRVDHSLTARPKLFIPDIKAELHPVLDEGSCYPHHNLYFVDSERWDIRALGGLLLSDVAQMFIEAYAVRMRGGYLRFQAQYLRRIRVPTVGALVDDEIDSLKAAFANRDRELATAVALKLYGLDSLPA